MGKMNELSQIANSLRDAADQIDDLLSNAKKKAKAEPKQPELKLADVRKVLAKLSQEGKTSEVKEILNGFGADKLSDLPTYQYEALLYAVRAL